MNDFPCRIGFLMQGRCLSPLEKGRYPARRAVKRAASSTCSSDQTRSRTGPDRSPMTGTARSRTFRQSLVRQGIPGCPAGLGDVFFPPASIGEGDRYPAFGFTDRLIGLEGHLAAQGNNFRIGHASVGKLDFAGRAVQQGDGGAMVRAELSLKTRLGFDLACRLQNEGIDPGFDLCNPAALHAFPLEGRHRIDERMG